MINDYIIDLQHAIMQTHGCGSLHSATVPVTEVFEGKTVWQGDVEVFNLFGHPTASQCYAWGFKDDAAKWQYVAVLHTPPVDSPQAAVRAYIISRVAK